MECHCCKKDRPDTVVDAAGTRYCRPCWDGMHRYMAHLYREAVGLACSNTAKRLENIKEWDIDYGEKP
ncbi:unnamed protein product [marine sediment metagenome]|uniref:Zinc ribbon domain-containing protein n=1 Tax=marine sediment metagenome TaxID=412755 RepID=X1C6F1_9ZZZZ